MHVLLYEYIYSECTSTFVRVQAPVCSYTVQQTVDMQIYYLLLLSYYLTCWSVIRSLISDIILVLINTYSYVTGGDHHVGCARSRVPRREWQCGARAGGAREGGGHDGCWRRVLRRARLLSLALLAL